MREPTTRIAEPGNKEEVVEKFRLKIKTLIQSGLYDLDHVLNVDETGVCCEGTSTKTICFDEEEKNEGRKAIKHPATKSVNKDKENLTVVLTGSWTGVKLPAMLIFPDKGVKKLDRDVPENICKVHREEGSYMDRKTMETWVSKVLNPYSRKLSSNKKGLLLLDNFAGHISPEIKKAIQGYNYDVETLPANTTKYLQPLDLSVNRAFKSYISDQWENYASNLTDKDVTRTNKYQAPSRGVKMTWISRAWSQVKAESVANGFNIFKTCQLPEEQGQVEALTIHQNKPDEPAEEQRQAEPEDIDCRSIIQNPIDHENSEDDENFDVDSETEEDGKDEEQGNLAELAIVNENLLDYVIEYQDEV